MSEHPSDKFSHRIYAAAGDIDELGHVNNVVYLRWVQEVAAAHWQKVAPEEMQKAYSWVVLRHEIDYMRAALAGDEIIGYTWVEEPQGPKIIRYVSLYRAGEDQPLAEAKTTWCLLETATMRPRRISEEINRTFSQI